MVEGVEGWLRGGFALEDGLPRGGSKRPADMKSTTGGNSTSDATRQVGLHSMMPRMEISVRQLCM